jgi:hypothetical protein
MSLMTAQIGGAIDAPATAMPIPIFTAKSGVIRLPIPEPAREATATIATITRII